MKKLTVDLIKTYKKINDHYYARKRRIKDQQKATHQSGNGYKSIHAIQMDLIYDLCHPYRISVGFVTDQSGHHHADSTNQNPAKRGKLYNDGYDDERHDLIINPPENWMGR